MRYARGVTIALLFTTVAVSVCGQVSEPAWMRIARGDRHIEAGEFGFAIQVYREALALEPGNPEALFGLGRAFKAVSDYDEATGYLTDAITNAASLRVSAMEYIIRYELADLYRIRRDFASYERALSEIIARADSEPVPPRTVRAEGSDLLTTFYRSGLDRTLVLYRMPEDGGTRARGDYCELLNGLGRYEPAAAAGLLAVVQRLSTLIDAVLARDPEFEFVSVRDTLDRASIYPETRRYLQNAELFRDLYYFASAVYVVKGSESARPVWSTIEASEFSGRYAGRAAVQLRDPQPEPLLVPPR